MLNAGHGSNVSCNEGTLPRFKTVNFSPFAPKGLHVVVLGPDGSGKTSVIARVVSELAGTSQKTFCSHFRPGLGFKGKKRGPIQAPHGLPPRSLVASIAKIFYLWFDFSAGWFLVLRRKMNRSTLVIFDRYYHDILIDPFRYRYGGPMWLARWIGSSIPKPDLWILLDAPAEVMQKRKQEVPLKETDRQRQLYLNLIKKLKNGVVVDASKSLDEVTEDVKSMIVHFMVKRAETRNGY